MGRGGLYAQGIPDPATAATAEMQDVWRHAHSLLADRLAELPPGASAAMRAGCVHAALAQACARRLHELAGHAETPEGLVGLLGAAQRSMRASAQHDAAVLAHRREAIGTSAAQAEDLTGLLLGGGRSVETSGETVESEVTESGDDSVH